MVMQDAGNATDATRDPSCAVTAMLEKVSSIHCFDGDRGGIRMEIIARFMSREV